MAGIKRVLRQALLVALAGAAFAFAANQLSPVGIVLGRDDYFPKSSTNFTASLNANGSGVSTNANTNALTLAEKLIAENGLQGVTSNQIAALYQDPRYGQDLIVFVDARQEKEYQEGHVPGAYLFDHFNKENYLAAVQPVCAMADQVVLYCNGGNCEDSVFAAIDLRKEKIANEKLLVYTGGMREWTANGWPIEIGARNSGIYRTNVPAAKVPQEANR